MKKIIYTDKNKNEIDVNSVNGIFVILNDIMDNCNDENICLCVKENIKACIEKCYNDRIKELKTDKHQDKSMGSFRLIEAECYIRNIADNGNPDQECHQAPVFFDFIFLFQQLFFFDME